MKLINTIHENICYSVATIKAWYRNWKYNRQFVETEPVEIDEGDDYVVTGVTLDEDDDGILLDFDEDEVKYLKKLANEDEIPEWLRFDGTFDGEDDDEIIGI